jgi:hypothetical protein
VVSWEVCAKKAASSVRSWSTSPLLANAGKAAAASSNAHQLKKSLPVQAGLLMFGKKSAKSCSENQAAMLEPANAQDPVDEPDVDEDAVASVDVVAAADVVTATDVVTAVLVETGAVVVVSGTAVGAAVAVVAGAPEQSQ